MRKCAECGRRLWLRRECSCRQAQRAVSSSDDGCDTTGFMVGLMTGVPLSPTHGISAGALLGAALHSSDAPAKCDPPPSNSNSSSSSDSSSNYSSPDYSSSSSSDSSSSGSWSSD
jgi:hypothetical protein